MNLILLRGLPGSGKSTVAEKMAKEKGYVHLEADMFFMHNGIYLFDRSLLKKAHEWCQSKTLEYLRAGKTVVVANTFTQKWELDEYLKMGFPTQIYVVKGDHESIHDVPEAAVKAMKKRWENIEGETEWQH